MHTRIRALLAKDLSPHDKSMAIPQLALVETIEFGLESGDGAVGSVVGAVIGVGRTAYRGVASVILSSMTIGSGIALEVGNEIPRGTLTKA